MKKSRQVIIQDDRFPNKEWREGKVSFYHFWCDTDNCNNCPVRFYCYTTKDETITVMYPSDKIKEKIKEFQDFRWRLRDGSSRFRANRKTTM